MSDKSGKVIRVQTSANSAAPEAVIDTTYCYLADVDPGESCPASDGTNDRSKLQWSYDNISKQTTNYGYTDTDGKTPTKHLTGITQSGGSNPTNWAYTYDDAGNRTQAKATNAATKAVISDQKLTYNAVGQITNDGYQYDGTGNLVAAPGETYTYNGAQQMTSSTKDGVTTSYEYAGADMNKLLSQSTDGGAEYDYTYGTTDQNGVPVIATRAVAGTGIASVLSDPVTGQPLDLRTTDGSTSMYVLNGIGNPVAAVTDTGKIAYKVSYGAYGAETVTDGKTSTQWQQNPYGYKTGIRSSNSDTGLTKFGYRWQASTTGQWLERDTLDAPLSPNDANRYAFVGCDPINGSDPTGRISEGLKCALVFTGVALAIGALVAAPFSLAAAGAATVAAAGTISDIGGLVGLGVGAGIGVGGAFACA